MATYYNEWNKKAAEWLRQLIIMKLIPDGEVDERSIKDVDPGDLTGFTQHHLFAGIGGWAYALRKAGWSDDRPVLTGSCPCQPFSSAGSRKGFEDDRHLWGDMHRIISGLKPSVVFGEQVASADGLTWLDLVHSDMEDAGYAFAALDLCAAGFGAPHIRQRLYWLGDSPSSGLEGSARQGIQRGVIRLTFPSETLGLGNTERDGLLAVPQSRGEEDQGGMLEYQRSSSPDDARGQVRNPTNGFWANPEWLYCRDEKWRAIEPSLAPMVDGLPRGVVRGGDQGTSGYPIQTQNTAEAGKMRLMGYGNAINIEVAVGFIKAYNELTRV